MYGADGAVERMLSEIEGSAAHLIRTAIANPRELGLLDRTKLISFASLQRGRTEAALKHADDMATAFAEKMKDGGRVGLNPAMEAGLYEDNVGINLRTHMLGSPLLYDLKATVIVNRASVDFITSDHPTISINPAWKKLKGIGGYGLGSAGMIIGIALSPRTYFLAYDSQIYTAPGNTGVIECVRDDDVHMLNSVTSAFALKSLYFGPQQDVEHVAAYAAASEEERGAPKSTTEEFFDDGKGAYGKLKEGDPLPQEGNSLVVTSNRVFQMPFKLSFLGLRPKLIFDDDGSARGPVRDAIWARIHGEFFDRVSAGFLVEGGIFGFARAHRLYPLLGSAVRRAI